VPELRAVSISHSGPQTSGESACWTSRRSHAPTSYEKLASLVGVLVGRVEALEAENAGLRAENAALRTLS
jgi:hypothetical protein